MELTRTALEKWVETRRAIAKTQRDWQQDRQQLGDAIALLERDIAALREKIRAADDGAAEADTKKAELAAEVQRLQQAAHVFGERIDALEQRTRALLARLPDPIRAKVLPISQRLPASAEQAQKLDETKLSQRFLAVVGVVNEIEKWNREITITSEVRALGNGVSAEVTALYLGIGQGYFVTQNGDAAGIGSPGADGWAWTRHDESAQAIQLAIAMARNEKVAGYVPLPVQIR